MKKIPYAKQWIDNEDIKAVCAVLKSDYLTQGPRVEVFEAAISSYCEAKYAVAVNSGTSALHIACMAAGFKGGDEAITSPITFVASANCILYCGARPIFADVSEDTINIEPEEIERRITSKTKALLPIHFAGHPCDLIEIRRIAQRHNLIIIEDAAHALGAVYKNKKIGSCKYSDMTVLSFHAVKHITTGEGGMVLTNNRNFYEKLKLFRTHGITRDIKMLSSNVGNWYYKMVYLGFNYRLTDIQCALGISQLNKLARFIKRRREIVERYNVEFANVEQIKTLVQRPYVTSSYHLYVLKFDLRRFKVSRKDLFDEYRKCGIQVNVHYIPVYYHPYYKKIGYKKGLCPNAERYYEAAVTLPLYPRMKDADVKRVIKITKQIVNKFKIA